MKFLVRMVDSIVRGFVLFIIKSRLSVSDTEDYNSLIAISEYLGFSDIDVVVDGEVEERYGPMREQAEFDHREHKYLLQRNAELESDLEKANRLTEYYEEQCELERESVRSMTETGRRMVAEEKGRRELVQDKFQEYANDSEAKVKRLKRKIKLLEEKVELLGLGKAPRGTRIYRPTMYARKRG